MLKQQVIENSSIVTNDLARVEIADDYSRAIVIVPLFHVGANKKGLFWTAKMLKKLAPMYRGVAFRYDIGGQEGSSHTLAKLSSPHFDVGWTYSSDEGAWYDPDKKVVFVKGEVTHPDVIAKLARITSDGKREVNYASMGCYIKSAKCSICGAEMNGNECDNGHIRLEKYEGKTCYKVPTEIEKALHVALTNDPADGEAEIKNVLFQDCSDYFMTPENSKTIPGKTMEMNNQIPNSLAPEASTKPVGEVPSPETILQDLAERVKTLEGKFVTQPTPELVNDSPMTEEVEVLGDNKMEQPMNNPAPAVQQADPMAEIKGLLNQILAKLSGNETQDMGKESLSVNKGSMKKPQDNIPTSHEGPGDAVTDSDEEGNKKNKNLMTNGQGKIASADNSSGKNAEVADNSNSRDVELADMKTQMSQMMEMNKKLLKRLEIQDNAGVPEFGGRNSAVNTEFADMKPSEREAKYGEVESWSRCFN